LTALGLLLRRRSLGWLAIALLWLCSTPLVGDRTMRAAESWAVRLPAAQAPTADAIVVLSGGLVEAPGGEDEFNDAVDRFYGGVELLQAGRAPTLLFTGAWLPWRPDDTPEGEILAAEAVKLGAPRNRILVTGRASNTAEEAQAVAATLAAVPDLAQPPAILLVTSAFHMRRAQLLFERAGMTVIPYPVDFRASASARFTLLDLLPSAEALRNSELALRELYGVSYYFTLHRLKRLLGQIYIICR
jgi:uncharacterized SAM-binding protein YcdF (DUF218 family)